ncbi:hypothetical protein ABZX39_36915 [Streptomyces collinus]|uniref:hypothetical protein n=1 Tax=Streptomyces collinus TaxID=42684 RepID=UPI0033BA0214
MYSMEQAERIATAFLQQESANWDQEVALFKGDDGKAHRGESFYFSFQSARYIDTRNDKYFLYGATCIEVNGVTGECRFLGLQQLLAAGDPFNIQQ